MGNVSGVYVAGALVPALIITILFFFDHNVSSQMVQLKEFNMKKPAAYHYDFALLALMVCVHACVRACWADTLAEWADTHGPC